MSLPATREEFKYYCLRKLGWPVIDINLEEEQVEDRIDEALKYYADYHFDGSDPIYYKHRITANNFPDRINNLTIVSGGTGYANGEALVFSEGYEANASITTNANGTITAITLADNGHGFRMVPDITITTGAGTGASITAELGGFISVPENIIGAVRIFDLSDSIATNSMFSIQYQIAMNDLYTMSAYSMIPYYMTRLQLETIKELLVGHQPIRFSRHRNRVYVDMNWDRFKVGDFIIVEGYQTVDPTEYTDVWSDRWLAKYTTALIKKNWGEAISKFKGMQLPGGVEFNGREILMDAVAEIAKLEEEMIYTYSIPNSIMIG
jgi:hypothetical protein